MKRILSKLTGRDYDDQDSKRNEGDDDGLDEDQTRGEKDMFAQKTEVLVKFVSPFITK